MLLLFGCAGAAKAATGGVLSKGFPGGICGADDSLDDCLALVSVYDAFGGPGSRSCNGPLGRSFDPWDGWLRGSSYCSWLGVECNDGGYVRSLRVPASCQTGAPYDAPYQLPPGVGRFVEVEELYLPYANAMPLSGWWMNGTIPSSLTNLTSLRRLEGPHAGVSGNRPTDCTLGLGHTGPDNCITGVLPESLGAMTALRSVNWMLRQYLVSGTLPASMFKMQALVNLSLGFRPNRSDAPDGELLIARISGTLPTNCKVALPALTDINLVGYRRAFEGSASISGGIPAWVASLPALEHLAIVGNAWTGPLPVTFASPALRSIILNASNTTSSGVFDITAPTGTELTSLYVNGPGFTAISPNVLKVVNATTLDRYSPSCKFVLPDLTGVAYLPPQGSSIACSRATGDKQAFSGGSYFPCSTVACPTGLAKLYIPPAGTSYKWDPKPCTVVRDDDAWSWGLNCTGPNH